MRGGEFGDREEIADVLGCSKNCSAISSLSPNSPPLISRRQLLTGMLVFPRLAMTLLQPTGIEIVAGLGTNVVVLTSSDGVILVDSGAPQFSDALKKELGSRHVQTVF